MTGKKFIGISRRDFLQIAGGLTSAGMLFLLLRPKWTFSSVRPPGALPEGAFEAACIRCGRCISACVQNAIEIDVEGLPYIDGLSGWCNFSMDCIEVCPSGALLPIDPATAKIGTAIIDRDRCIAWQYPACRLCYEKCLDIQQAIWLDDDLRPHVDETLCTGCAACTNICPKAALIRQNKKYGKAISIKG